MDVVTRAIQGGLIMIWFSILEALFLVMVFTALVIAVIHDWRRKK